MPADRAVHQGYASPLARALAHVRQTHADITLTELVTFLAIVENEGVTVSGLARLCGFTEATASRTIRGLAPADMPGALSPSRGLAHLMRGPTENRSRHAFLTPAGRGFRDDLKTVWEGHDLHVGGAVAMIGKAIGSSTGFVALARRAAVAAVFALTPLVGLAGCSGQDVDKGRATGAEQVAGAPAIGGPMLATPGLWRTTTTVEGRPVLGARLECVDAASQKASAIQAPAAAGCKAPVQRPVPGGYAYDLTCEQDGLTTTVAGEVKGDAGRVILSSTTRMVGPDGDVMPVSRVVIENVHVGPCPSDMKPGDGRPAP